MKQLSIIIVLVISFVSFAQEKDKEALLAIKKANDYVYEGNELLNEDEFVSAEMEFRKAISEQANNVAGTYNLWHAYYKKGKSRLLANIYSFVIQNLTQHIHHTPWTFRNDSQPSIDRSY